MKTVGELKAEIQRNLLELEKLGQNPWSQTKYARAERYVLKEKDIGRLCCETEEMLNADDLIQFKQALNIDDHRWDLYKFRFVHFRPEED